MRSKRNRFWSHDNRFRLMLTLGLAVLLPAAALIYVNFHHLESIKRDKKVEALIHRDFQYVLAVSEKRLNHDADQEFGYERLEAQLRSARADSANAVLFSVLGSVQDFAAARPLVDDMSLAIVSHRTLQRSKDQNIH